MHQLHMPDKTDTVAIVKAMTMTMTMTVTMTMMKFSQKQELF